jgi:hypothetical protein
MDLPLYARVLWRFRVLVFIGLVLAAALSFFSYAKVSFAHGSPKVGYRTKVVYQSTVTLLVTQNGFPWGRTQLPFKVDAKGVATSNFADPGRLSSLAGFYSRLAESDVIRVRASQLAGIPAVLTADPVPDPGNSNAVLPMISLAGYATSPAAAIRVASAGSLAFRQYLLKQQSESSTPADQRVVMQVLNQASAASIASPRKKTLPVIVFLGVLIATIAVAFVLENLRPRVRVVATGARTSEATPDVAHTA